MPGMAQANAGAIRNRVVLVEGYGREARKRALGIGNSVEWERRLVLREFVAVGILGVLLLQIRAIEQQDFAEILGGVGTEDRTGEAVAHESRQVARMVEMRVRQHGRRDARWIDRKRRPVSEPQLL